VKAENPAALRYILQDEIYLLKSEKVSLQIAPAPVDLSIAQSLVTPPSDVKLPDVVSTPSNIKQPDPLPETPIIPAPTETATPTYNYHGKNKKSFLILTHYVNEDFIAAGHLMALQNILKRKDYDIDDVAIFNTAKTNAAITDLVAYFKPEKLLILGEAAVPAGMGVPPLNQPKKMKNGLLLHSFSFDEMMSSNENKKAFWEQMKNL
jgi:hypothetical protein